MHKIMTNSIVNDIMLTYLKWGKHQESIEQPDEKDDLLNIRKTKYIS